MFALAFIVAAATLRAVTDQPDGPGRPAATRKKPWLRRPLRFPPRPDAVASYHARAAAKAKVINRNHCRVACSVFCNPEYPSCHFTDIKESRRAALLRSFPIQGDLAPAAQAAVFGPERVMLAASPLAQFGVLLDAGIVPHEVSEMAAKIIKSAHRWRQDRPAMARPRKKGSSPRP